MWKEIAILQAYTPDMSKQIDWKDYPVKNIYINKSFNSICLIYNPRWCLLWKWVHTVILQAQCFHIGIHLILCNLPTQFILFCLAWVTLKNSSRMYWKSKENQCKNVIQMGSHKSWPSIPLYLNSITERRWTTMLHFV